MSFLSGFLDLIFPPVCLSCGRFGEFICQSCQQSFTILPNQICPHCLKSNAQGFRHAKCKGNITGLISCWNYEENMQKIIKAIKYGYYFVGLKPLINLFLNTVNLEENSSFQTFLATKPILVPVPLHKSRLRTRDFNQAEIITKTLAQAWDLPYSTKIIQRTKNTNFQAELGKKARQQNVKHAFAPTQAVLKLTKKPLQNRTVLLIDDVWTTGATAQVCAHVLKKLGAGDIWSLTLAR